MECTAHKRKDTGRRAITERQSAKIITQHQITKSVFLGFYASLNI